MGDQDNISAIIYHTKNESKPTASVILNGYNINAGSALGHIGAMRSFKLKHGDLWDEWSTRVELHLVSQDGREARVRVAAHPADEDSFGLIEFLPNSND